MSRTAPPAVKICLFGLVVLFAMTSVAQAYDPPIGIPEPPFGIDEDVSMYDSATYDFGSGGVSYPDEGDGPYTHYVDNTDPNATDTSNPYGTPSVPRKTPTGGTSGGTITLAAGSVMEIHGGPYANTGYPKVIAQGTASKPVIFRGADPDNPVEFTGVGTNDQIFEIEGSYIILENIKFTDGALVRIVANSDHVSIRNCEVDNTGFSFGGRGAAVVVGAYSEYCVIYNNNIHHNTKMDGEEIQDLHGTTTGTGSSNIWFLENHIHHNSGDAFQALHYASVAPHHIYLGRNVMHDDRENGIDLKTIDDVVISENVLYNYTSSGSSAGDAVVFGSNGYSEQYGPLRVSFLFNEIYNAESGLRVEGVEDCWIVGNTFYDIDGNGITLDIDGDSDNVNIVHNTIADVGGDGIHHHWQPGATNINILSNIISDVADAHIEIGASLISDVTVEYNLLYQNGSDVYADWGVSNYYTQSASTLNAISGWANNVVDDPDFVDAASFDFHLDTSSSATDAGTATDAYDDFYTIYTIDIEFDNDGTARPLGNDWDIGAFEDDGTGSPSNSAPSVSAGSDAGCTLPSGVSLDGTVTDDGNPDPPGAFTVAWSKISGPGTVTFGSSTSVDTTASFSTAGTYVLRLMADDDALTSYDDVSIAANAAPSWTGEGNFTESGGTVVMEAENWDDNDTVSSGSPWVEATTRTGYVGDGYMGTPWDASTKTWSTGCKLSYDIDFVTAGTYKVWMYVNYDGHANNHSLIGMDGTEEFEFGSATFSSWHWNSESATIYVTAGTHTFEIVMKKKYFYVDRIILTDDLSYTPSGTGPAESSRDTNVTPTVSAGSDDECTLPSGVTLDGTVSDDGLPNPPASVTVTWSKTSGPGTVTFVNSSAVDTTASFSTDGTYVLQLEADDGRLTMTDTVQIVVNADPNTAPTANAGSDDSITLPSVATLDGTITDDGYPNPPGAVTAYWSKTSGPGTVTFGDSSAVDTTASFSEIGTYVLQLEADDGSLIDTDTVQIVCGHAAPSVDAGSDDSITLPSDATLDGTVSDDGFPASPGSVTTTWSKTSGPGTVTFGDSSAVDTTAGFSTDGTYVLRLTADDGDKTAYDELTVTVAPANTAPTVDAGSDDECTLPSGVTLDGTVGDDGLPDPPASVTTTWSKTSGAGTVTFGDSAAVDTTASFSAADTYVLRLTADDNDLSAYDEVTIAVNAAPAGTNNFQESGGTVVMEAENWDDNDTVSSQSPWLEATSRTGYVGDGYMGTPWDASTKTWSTGCKLSYDIDFVTAGTYKVWMYVNYDGHANNHSLIGMDGTEEFEFGSATFSSWHWNSESATVYVTADTHTFEIVMKEKYFYVDRIILTDDLSYTPSGTGPAESDRGSNEAPTADAGSDDSITLPSIATLDGTVTDDGLPNPPASVTTTWTKISGPGTVTFGDSSAVDTTASFSEIGTYVLQLEADDGDLTDSDTVQIVCGHTAPSVDAGSDDECTLPSGVTLDGTVSDDGFPASPGSVTTTWSKTSGAGTVTFGDSAAVDTTASFSAADTYVLRLTADDNDLSAFDELTVIVNAAPAGTGNFQESGGTVVMEAENWDDNDTVSSGSPWVEATTRTGYVGDGYMGTPWDASTKTWSTGCKLSYDIDFVTAGTYKVWMYVNYDGHANNHSLIGMDGTEEFEFGSATFSSWHWNSESATVYVTADTHTFEIVMKEKYFYVDRIILTDDLSYTPSGTGPAESSRGGGGGNSAPSADAGSDDSITLPSIATLDGTVTDDGLPDPPASVTTTWSKISGPGNVTFGDSSAVDTTASFSEIGTYVLQLEADDNELTDTDTVQIVVAAADTAFQESGGTVVMECENFDNNDTSSDGSPWLDDTSYSGYVGTGYMAAPSSGGSKSWSTGAALTYDIDFTTAGTYYIWVRRYADSAQKNEAFVGLNGTQIGGTFDGNGSYDQWNWQTHGTAVYISSGSQQFNLRRREKEYGVDRIILTDDSGYTPSGNGPAESSRE